MAKPLNFEPMPPASDKTEKEVQRLLDSMSDAGVLRAMSNLLSQRHEVAEVVLSRMAEDEGKQGLNNLLILARGLAHLDSDLLNVSMSRVTDGINQGKYKRIVEEETPNVFQLLKQLNDPAVRRGLALILDVLQALGGSHPHVSRET